MSEPPSHGSDDCPVLGGRNPELPQLSEAQIRAQLERILDSPLFTTSESLRAFLRFTVNRTLEGRGDELKEYLLGVEVFRRGAQFDPRLDSIVRVQGSKVRAKLRDYYETYGHDDAVWIELPKGAYVPVFRERTPPKVLPMSEPVPLAPPFRSWRPTSTSRLLLTIALAFGAITLGVVYTQKERADSPLRERKLLQLTFDAGLTTDPALSPNGKLVAYVSDRSGEDHLDLWIQPVEGGAALRLTHGAADVREPGFSPDSSAIVFRSEHEAGGIYVVSVLGGEPRRLGPKGRRPQFSPDGRSIVYWSGEDVYGGLYILPAEGGIPRRVNPEFHHATYPVWTPDGKHLLFWGYQSNDYTDADWWVVSLASGRPVKTGIAKTLAQNQLEPDIRVLGDWIWFGGGLIMSARQADSTNLWRIPLSSETFHVTGNPQRLTFGAGQDVLPSVSRDGQMVFASLRKTVQIWALPADVNEGVARGGIEQLTTDAVVKAWPSISADGRYVVFTAYRGGRQEIWLRDLRTQKDRRLTPAPAAGIVPVITSDGSEVAFGPPFPRQGEKVGLYTVRTQDALPEMICEECGYPASWSHDKSKIMYHVSPRGDPSWLDRKSGEKHPFLRHPVYALWEGRFSPDDRWVAFVALKQPNRHQIYIARFPNAAGSDESAWIPVTGDARGDGHIAWSPDGHLLYYVSDRDGWPCLWAQRLDDSMRPRGAPHAVSHLHEQKLSIRNVTWHQFTLSVAEGRLVFNLGELTGNVWMTRIGSL